MVKIRHGDDYLTTRRIIWSGKGSEITLFLHLVALAQEEEGEFMIYEDG